MKVEKKIKQNCSSEKSLTKSILASNTCNINQKVTQQICKRIFKIKLNEIKTRTRLSECFMHLNFLWIIFLFWSQLSVGPSGDQQSSVNVMQARREDEKTNTKAVESCEVLLETVRDDQRQNAHIQHWSSDSWKFRLFFKKTETRTCVCWLNLITNRVAHLSFYSLFMFITTLTYWNFELYVFAFLRIFVRRADVRLQLEPASGTRNKFFRFSWCVKGMWVETDSKIEWKLEKIMLGYCESNVTGKIKS